MHLLNPPFWTQSGASAWTHKHSLNIVMGPCRPPAGLPLLHVWPGSGQGVAVPPSQLRSACLYLPPSCETRGNAGRHEQEAVSIIHASLPGLHCRRRLCCASPSAFCRLEPTVGPRLAPIACRAAKCRSIRAVIDR